MKKIGEGYYYNVFLIGNEKVSKKIKSRLRTFLFILFSRKGNPDFWREYKNTIKNIDSIESMYSILKNTENSFPLLGNPVFQSKGIEYIQDKAAPLRVVLKSIEEEEGRVIIEKLILFIKKTWTLGFADRVFNFTVNNGLNKNGDIVLFDFNEITFLKDDVKKDIESKVWLQRWSFSHLNTELKKYYAQRMEEELTLEALDLIWVNNTNLK